MHMSQQHYCHNMCKALSCFLLLWVRSRNCGCLVTWFCYQLLAKPGNKTAAVLWPDPYDLIQTDGHFAKKKKKRKDFWYQKREVKQSCYSVLRSCIYGIGGLTKSHHTDHVKNIVVTKVYRVRWVSEFILFSHPLSMHFQIKRLELVIISMSMHFLIKRWELVIISMSMHFLIKRWELVIVKTSVRLANGAVAKQRVISKWCVMGYCFLGPLLLTWFNLIPTWMSNYIHFNVWDEITYPFLNFNSATIEV